MTYFLKLKSLPPTHAHIQAGGTAGSVGAGGPHDVATTRSLGAAMTVGGGELPVERRSYWHLEAGKFKFSSHHLEPVKML